MALDEPEGADAPDLDDGLPVILYGNDQIRHVTAQLADAMRTANDPPITFRQGTGITGLFVDERGRPKLQGLERRDIAHRAERAANFRKMKKEGAVPIPVPPIVISDLMTFPIPPFPPIARVVTAPVFTNNGDLLQAPGYDPASRIYYFEDASLAIPPVSPTPTAAEIEKAKSLILDEMLHDFDFVHEAERCHALALALLPSARDLIAGQTPIHLLEAPTSRTGKTLLARCVLGVSMGDTVSVMQEATSLEEWRKRLVSELLCAPTAVIIDNVNEKLASGVLASYLTAPRVRDRRLGFTQMVEVDVNCVWVVTANNPSLSSEIAGRCVRIRIDSQMERPQDRTGFKHPLPRWVWQNRGDLIWAQNTLIQAWVIAGRPAGTEPLGGFEEWAETMGGIMDVIGVPGFLRNKGEIQDDGDAERAVDYAFVMKWWETFGTQRVGVRELWPVARDFDLFEPGPEAKLRVRLGLHLAKLRSRRFGQIHVVGESKAHGSGQTYRLEEL